MDLLSLPRAAFTTTLGAATGLRGARVFHPHGQTSAAVVEVTGGLGEALRFEPTLGSPDLQPVALLRTVRARSYDASQAAREVTDASLRLMRTTASG